MDQVSFEKGDGTLALIARIRDSKGAWVPVKQLHTECLQHFLAMQSLNNIIKRTEEAVERLATSEELDFLFQVAAVSFRAKKLRLLACEGLGPIMRQIRLSQVLAEVLPKLAELPACEGAAISAMGDGSADPTHTTLRGFPMNLPVCSVPEDQMKHRYTLSKQLRGLLKDQISAFQSWSMQAVQLDRLEKAITIATWQNISKTIYLYLGFLYNHLRVKQAALGLECFLNLQHYSKFMAYQVEKRRSMTSLTQVFSHTNKVISFLSRQSANPSHTLITKCENTVRWLQRLRKQLGHHMPKETRDIGTLMAANKWVDAASLVAMIDEFARAAVAKAPARGECSYFAARDLHDACLVSCMFGHLPPVRLVCLRTLQVPGSPKCLVAGCNRRDCRGNILQVQSSGGLNMVFSHYKVDQKWGGIVMEFGVPQELAHMLLLFLKTGHSVTCPDQQFVFTKADGMPMTQAAHLSYYWEGLSKKIGCKAKLHPHLLRHIFVDERRSASRVQGPADAQAAMIMGNTKREWDGSYDLNFKRRESQEGVDAMAQWRAAMLGKAAMMPSPSAAQADDLVIEVD